MTQAQTQAQMQTKILRSTWLYLEVAIRDTKSLAGLLKLAQVYIGIATNYKLRLWMMRSGKLWQTLVRFAIESIKWTATTPIALMDSKNYANYQGFH